MVEGNDFTLKATVPPNTTAAIRLPDGTSREVGSGVHGYTTEIEPLLE